MSKGTKLLRIDDREITKDEVLAILDEHVDAWRTHLFDRLASESVEAVIDLVRAFVQSMSLGFRQHAVDFFSETVREVALPK